ncbi:hypothetical protein OIU78_018401, partial [Salix suchowensis]
MGVYVFFIAACLHSHFILILYKSYGFDLLRNPIIKYPLV